MTIENVRKIQKLIVYGLIISVTSIGVPIMLKVGPPVHNWLSAWGFRLGTYYHELVMPLLRGIITPLFGYWLTFILPLIALIHLHKVRGGKKPNKTLVNLLLLTAMLGPYISYAYASFTTPEIVENVGGNYLILLFTPIWIYILPMPGIVLSCGCVLFLRAIMTPVGKYLYRFKYR